MLELAGDIRRHLARGERMAMATVVATRRSAPRPVGAKLLLGESGALAGSVSGGCVEADVARVAAEVLGSGRPQLLTYGITSDDALDLGLPCGGEIDVFVEALAPALAERALDVAGSGRRAVLLTVLDGPQAGRRALAPLGDHGPSGADAIEGDAIDGVGDLVERSAALEHPGVLDREGIRVLADVQGPPVRLAIVGAYDVAEELCALAGRLGWPSVVVDARERFATSARLPSATEIVVGWPQQGLAQAGLDRTTAVIVLTHDHKFDVPALAAALASDAFYVGALGSRGNQERRIPRLLEAGVPAEAIARIDGPAGLDIGGETPAETAVSIVAQVIAARRGRAGGPLGAATGPIHAPR